MEQAQRVREHEIEYGQSIGATLRGCRSRRQEALFSVFRVPCSVRRLWERFNGFSEDCLARLDVPVAILAPEEAIKGLCRFIEAILGEGRGDLSYCPVELQQNPLVVGAEQRPVNFTLHLAALHLAEPACVPELV